MPDPTDLTERQQQVLALHREGKNPTDIGRELSITSQGVHGHLRRLAARGLVELERPARARDDVPNGRLDPDEALRAVRQAAIEQVHVVTQRLTAIDGEIEALRNEKKGLQKALEKLNEQAQVEL